MPTLFGDVALCVFTLPTIYCSTAILQCTYHTILETRHKNGNKGKGLASKCNKIASRMHLPPTILLLVLRNINNCLMKIPFILIYLLNIILLLLPSKKSYEAILLSETFFGVITNR